MPNAIISRSLLLVLLIAMSMLSCKKEDVGPKSHTYEEVLECVGEIENPDDEFVCDDDYPYDTNNDSRCVKDLGSFSLLDESKGCVPTFCMNIGEEMVFVNKEGEELVITLADKTYSKSMCYYSPNFDCEFLLPVYYCYECDVVYLELTVPSKNLEFLFKLYPAPLFQDNGEDRLFVYSRTGNSGSYQLEGILFRNNYHVGTPSYPTPTHDEISILGKKYMNVIKSEAEIWDRFNFYYNCEQGWIGYYDKTEDELWRIK